MRDFLWKYGYRVRFGPVKDKHAQGGVEHGCGNVIARINAALLSPPTPLPESLWFLAGQYVTATMGYNFNASIGTSPHMLRGNRPIDCRVLQPFGCLCWVQIPVIHRRKVGDARAYLAMFVGYADPRVCYANYLVKEVMPRESDGRTVLGPVMESRNVVFNAAAHEMPSDAVFEERRVELDLPPSLVTLPAGSPVYDIPAVGADIMMPSPPPSAPSVAVPTTSDRLDDFRRMTRSQSAAAATGTIATLRTITLEEPDDEDDDIASAAFLEMVKETSRQHYGVVFRLTYKDDSRIPRSFHEAASDPRWRVALLKEMEKFDTKYAMFRIVDDTGQPRVGMQWLFEVKDDGTDKARLVGRGDQCIETVHYPSKGDTYCGNVNPDSIKLALKIAAIFGSVMRGGDCEGAYLVTRAVFPIFVYTPPGWNCPPGKVFEVVGNAYGFPTSGHTFSESFDLCVLACGFKSTPWDPKFFFKWTAPGQRIVLLIAHSDDFRMFMDPVQDIGEYAQFIAALSSQGYSVVETTDKPFVGVRIRRLEDGSYTMDQSQFIGNILRTATESGCGEIEPHDMPWPYRREGEKNLSKADCGEHHPEMTKADRLFPYRTIVGMGIYVLIHTGLDIMFPLNVLSRYVTNFGPRHVAYLRHLLRYLRYSRENRLRFRPLADEFTMEKAVEALQLSYYYDADFAGNMDTLRSQTCYIGLAGGDPYTWNSTTQGSLSLNTAESELKAATQCCKKALVPDRRLLDAMGFPQRTASLFGDNQAVEKVSINPNLTKGLRYTEVNQMWFKELHSKQILQNIGVSSASNCADIGTKYVDKPTFVRHTDRLLDKSVAAEIRDRNPTRINRRQYEN